MVRIRKFKKDDINQVAKIHFNYLKLGRLSSLGESFLKDFYKTLLSQDNIITYVALQDNMITGFATLGINFKNLPIVMVKNLWFKTISVVLRNPSLLFKLIQLPFYPSFKDTSKDYAEILSLVVVPKARGQGIGRKLVESCDNFAKKMGCKNFVLSTRARMQDANDFYEKIGFKKIKIVKFLGEDFVFWQRKL